MIKIVFSEVESPTTAGEAIDLNRSTGVRAVNTAKTPSTLSIIDPETGHVRSITLVGGESMTLKKSQSDEVFSSTKTIRISGVSIY